jgi:hypothetical protein
MLLLLLFFAFPGFEFTSEAYKTSFNIGPLATEQCYGCDSFCEVSARPLYSGDMEGLPLYKIFEADLCNLVGFEFRKPYYSDPPHEIPGCGCTAPRMVYWEGYTIGLSDRQKIIFHIFSTCDLFN